jgi:hypothetical protein
MHTLEILDTKSRTKRVYEYNDSIIAQIKSSQHVFWDDIPIQVTENSQATKSA